MNEIYAVMHDDYEDWEIYGYFTDKHEAEKYCVAHPKDDLRVETIRCFDGKEDLSNISVKYCYAVTFNKKDNTWVMQQQNEQDCYDIYSSDYLRSNYVRSDCGRYFDWIQFYINIEKDDRKLAEKIAQDLLYQFLYMCDNKPTENAVKDMNKILSKDEDERSKKEKQGEIFRRELEELARLKAKYEK
jgi:hypothetical protein